MLRFEDGYCSTGPYGDHSSTQDTSPVPWEAIETQSVIPVPRVQEIPIPVIEEQSLGHSASEDQDYDAIPTHRSGKVGKLSPTRYDRKPGGTLVQKQRCAPRKTNGNKANRGCPSSEANVVLHRSSSLFLLDVMDLIDA